MSENWANCTECSDLNARLVRGSVQLSLDCLFLVLQLITLPVSLRAKFMQITVKWYNKTLQN